MKDDIIHKELINPRHRKRIYTAKWIIEIPPGEPYVIVKPKSEKNLTPHNLLLYATIDALKDEIDAYKADAVKYPNLPELNINLNIGPRRIDLITSRNGELEYWEIKTPREIGEDRTRQQLFEYLHYIGRINLVTSEDGVKNARELLKILKIHNKVKLYAVKPHLGDPSQKSELIYIPID